MSLNDVYFCAYYVAVIYISVLFSTIILSVNVGAKSMVLVGAEGFVFSI